MQGQRACDMQRGVVLSCRACMNWPEPEATSLRIVQRLASRVCPATLRSNCWQEGVWVAPVQLEATCLPEGDVASAKHWLLKQLHVGTVIPAASSAARALPMSWKHMSPEQRFVVRVLSSTMTVTAIKLLLVD